MKFIANLLMALLVLLYSEPGISPLKNTWFFASKYRNHPLQLYIFWGYFGL